MASPSVRRCLVVNADDFGLSHSINQAVIRAHQEGILTSASLMVRGNAVEEAVELARQNPRLGVGLHLTLAYGRSVLSPEEIPGLVDAESRFSDNAVSAGCRYFFQSDLKEQLHREIEAQFRAFHSYGIPLDHVNGHLNIHLHPTIFSILISNSRDWGIEALRLTRDPFWLNAGLGKGRWLYRISHAMIYAILSGRARAPLQARGVRHTTAVFGLLQNALVDEPYVSALIERLPEGNSELYSHPSLDEFKHELDALISPRVRKLIESRGIQLVRYQDL